MSTNKNILTTELISIEGAVEENDPDSSATPHHINMSYHQEMQAMVDNNDLLSETEGKTHSNLNNNDSKSEYDGVEIKTATKPLDKTYNTVILIHNESQFQSYVFSGTISKLIICEFMAKSCPRSRSFMPMFNTLSRAYGKRAMFLRICEEEQDGKSNWYNNYKKLDSIHEFELQFYQNSKLLDCHLGINKEAIRDIVRKHLGIESQQRHNSQEPNKEQRNIVHNQKTKSNTIVIDNYFINNNSNQINHVAHREQEPYPCGNLRAGACIVCILCACGGGWICALWAFRLAGDAETAYRRGHYDEYRSARRSALICIVIACMVGMFGWVVFIVTKGFDGA